MAFEITTIRNIRNDTEEPVTVTNLEKGQHVPLGAKQQVTTALHVPWMMSAGDFTAPQPHLLMIRFDFTGDFVYFWQRDQHIFRGTTLANGHPAQDYSAVMGGRDMIIDYHGAFIFPEGKMPQKFQVGPAMETVVWGKTEPQD